MTIEPIAGALRKWIQPTLKGRTCDWWGQRPCRFQNGLRLIAMVLLAVANSAPADDAKALSSKPATYAEFVNAIDLTKLARMPGAEKENFAASHLTYSVAGKLADAMEFHRNALTGLGWVEVKESVPGLDPEKYALQFYDKAGFCVSVYASQSQTPDRLDVYVQSAGNVDPRNLPRPADAQMVNALRTNLTFTTAGKPEAVEDFCRKAFSALGWKEEGDDSAAFHRKEGRYILNFVYNAMKLLIVISTNKRGQTEVNYLPQLRENAELLAKPADAKGIKPATRAEAIAAIDFRKFPRFRNAKTERVSSEGVFYQVEGKYAEVVAFNRRQFRSKGWNEIKPPDVELDDRIQVHFEKGGFHVEFAVSIDRKTRKLEVSARNEGNVDVRLLPRPSDARIGIAEHANAYYTTATKMDAVADFLRKELAHAGWKESGSTENLPGKVLTFYQNAIKLNIEIGVNEEGRTQVKLNPWVLGAP